MIDIKRIPAHRGGKGRDQCTKANATESFYPPFRIVL
jgi:hypothetical protein